MSAHDLCSRLRARGAWGYRDNPETGFAAERAWLADGLSQKAAEEIERLRWALEQARDALKEAYEATGEPSELSAHHLADLALKESP